MQYCNPYFKIAFLYKKKIKSNLYLSVIKKGWIAILSFFCQHSKNTFLLHELPYHSTKALQFSLVPPPLCILKVCIQIQSTFSGSQEDMKSNSTFSREYIFVLNVFALGSPRSLWTWLCLVFFLGGIVYQAISQIFLNVGLDQVFSKSDTRSTMSKHVYSATWKVDIDGFYHSYCYSLSYFDLGDNHALSFGTMVPKAYI